MSRETDIAWAAGLFEGEGCFSFSHSSSRRTKTPRMSLVTTDLDVLEKFAGIMGIGGIHPLKQQEGQRKPQYMWVANRGKDFEYGFELLRGHLGKRRLDRGLEIVEGYQSQVEEYTQGRPCPTCGETFRPMDTYFASGNGHSPKRYCNPRCRPSYGGRRKAHRERV